MKELTLILSDDLPTEESERLRVAISQHMPVGETKRYLRLSGDPSLTPLIQLIASADVWFYLKAAAGIFLAALVKRAADATWDWAQSLAENREAKPITEIASALALTSRLLDSEIDIIVGVDVPDDFFGTCLAIRTTDPTEIANKLACFVAHAQELTNVMEAEINAGRGPIGRAIVEVQEDASLIVKWYSMEDRQKHERRIP